MRVDPSSLPPGDPTNAASAAGTREMWGWGGSIPKVVSTRSPIASGSDLRCDRAQVVPLEKRARDSSFRAGERG